MKQKDVQRRMRSCPPLARDGKDVLRLTTSVVIYVPAALVENTSSPARINYHKRANCDRAKDGHDETFSEATSIVLIFTIYASCSGPKSIAHVIAAIPMKLSCTEMLTTQFLYIRAFAKII